MTRKNATIHLVVDLETGTTVFYATNWEAARMKYEDVSGRYGMDRFSIHAVGLSRLEADAGEWGDSIMFKTKREFETYFRQEVLPYVRERFESDGELDRIARRETWINVVDAMARDGELPGRAVDWRCPW